MFDYMQLGWQWRFSTLVINPSTPDMLYAGQRAAGFLLRYSAPTSSSQ